MYSKRLTDEEVDLEIQRLSRSPMVQLALKEIQVRTRRRRYMYNLRNLEKRGQALADSGLTIETLYNMARDMDQQEELMQE